MSMLSASLHPFPLPSSSSHISPVPSKIQDQFLNFYYYTDPQAHNTHALKNKKKWQQTPNDPNELFSGACMYTCPVGQLGSNNLCVTLSLDKSDYTSLIISSHSTGPFGIPPAHIGIPKGAVIAHVLFRQPRHWDFMDRVSLSCLDDST